MNHSVRWSVQERMAAIRSLVHMMAELFGYINEQAMLDDEFSDRPIHLTPCKGVYDEIASWTVIIEGSPPRGELFITPEVCIYVDPSAGTVKRLEGKQLKVVDSFRDIWLFDRTGPFVIVLR